MHTDTTREGFLAQAAADRARALGRPVLASLTRPTNKRDPIAIFSESEGVEDRAVWLWPDTGEALVAVGRAYSLTSSGAPRFSALADTWCRLMADAFIETSAPFGPLALGGFSFDPQREASDLWDGFPDARMVLPERLFATRAGAAWLTTNTIAEPRGVHLERARTNRQPMSHARTGLAPREWQDLVATTAHGIRDGSLGVQKVVLARAQQAQPTRSIAAALRTLAADYPSCTVFAFAHGGACFLGASPERLISLHDGTATTMALAGTALRGATIEEDDAIAECLRGDPKERVEHSLVVGALRDALDDVCARVVVDAQPRVRKLSNVQHLLTALHGQVESGRGVLDLVERLHPTPAVGGLPRARAEHIIRQQEALDRGWYGGPIGWMDARGEGEFVVGLRSAVVSQDRATLFAGCGIVGDSNPATEYAEWGWKLRPMQIALGIEP